MSKYEAVYKLVRLYDGSRYSAVLKQVLIEGLCTMSYSNTENRRLYIENIQSYSVEYIPGQWTYPAKGKENSLLMAFDSLQDANSFLCRFRGTLRSQFEIWLAEAVGVYTQYHRIASIGLYNLDDFWSRPDRRADYDDYYFTSTPQGTVFCKRIRLTKRMWPVEEGDEDE